MKSVNPEELLVTTQIKKNTMAHNSSCHDNSLLSIKQIIEKKTNKKNNNNNNSKTMRQMGDNMRLLYNSV